MTARTQRSRPKGLAAQVADLRAQLAEATDTLEAIRSGAVDALIVSSPEGDRVFSIQGAETPYRFLVEQIGQGALLLHPEGTILYANSRFAQLSATPLEQVIGAGCGRFFPLAEPSWLEGLLAAARNGAVCREVALQPQGGLSRPVELSLCLLKGAQAETFSAIVTDLSERRLAEAALRQANEQLEGRVAQRTEELQRAKAELERHNHHLEERINERTTKLRQALAEMEHFSYAIVHDMRAPLRAMQGFAAMAEQECVACQSPLTLSYFQRIKTASRRMDDLIRDSLNYSKALGQELPSQAVDMAHLLRDLVETYPNLQPERADILLEGRFPSVLGNEAALSQCFGNLLDNAVKFAKPGARSHIRVWSESPAATSAAASPVARFWVEDDGVGIAEELQPRIFEMFQRGSKHYEGTGIGLAIVHKLAERMGGRVGVLSREGQGSRFWLELPVAGG